jgi:hypothetical protein
VGLRSSCGTIWGGQVLISISNSAVGPAAGEQTKNSHGQLRQRDIKLCVLAALGETLRSGKTKWMKCCVTRWCLIKELNYYQTHPQQQRIASRRLYFCNVALHKGHNLIHMATSLPKLKAIQAVC